MCFACKFSLSYSLTLSLSLTHSLSLSFFLSLSLSLSHSLSLFLSLSLYHKVLFFYDLPICHLLVCPVIFLSKISSDFSNYFSCFSIQNPITPLHTIPDKVVLQYTRGGNMILVAVGFKLYETYKILYAN